MTTDYPALPDGYRYIADFGEFDSGLTLIVHINHDDRPLMRGTHTRLAGRDTTTLCGIAAHTGAGDSGRVEWGTTTHSPRSIAWKLCPKCEVALR